MKLIITADLHLGHTSKTHVKQMVNNIINDRPDIIVIAGDITEPAVMGLSEALELFDKSHVIKGLILGNHDLWNYYGKVDSSEKIWSEIAPKVCELHEFIWMEDDIIYYDDKAIVGSIAWYDYSNSNYYNNSDNFFYSRKKQFNNDGNYIDWDRTDIEFAKECRDGVVTRLKHLEDNPNINQVIVITHVPIFSEQMVKYKGDHPIGDAYFGHFALGKEVLKFDKVKHVVSGHTHRGMDREIPGFRMQTVNSDYGFPRYLTLNIE